MRLSNIIWAVEGPAGECIVGGRPTVLRARRPAKQSIVIEAVDGPEFSLA